MALLFSLVFMVLILLVIFLEWTKTPEQKEKEQGEVFKKMDISIAAIRAKRELK